MADHTAIEWVIRRKGSDESPAQASQGAGGLVAEVTCVDCGILVCVAQTDEWPPTGVVTLHIGTDWPEPRLFGNLVLCGDCGGPTTNVHDEFPELRREVANV